MHPKPRAIGRLAFREEGDKWCAYYALTDTLEGAIFLGAIAMRLVAHKKRRNEFMAVMRNAFSDVAEEAFGARPVWRKPTSAPAHEKSGHA